MTAPMVSTQPFDEPGVFHDQAGAERAGDPATEAAERVDQPHRLGEAGRLPIERDLRALRRAIPWTKAGAPRGDDEPVETVGETPKRRRDRVDTVLGEGALDDVPTLLREVLLEDLADASCRVPATTPSDTVTIFTDNRCSELMPAP